jgi:carbon-monoxide dehydrogenase medium subunit
MTHWKTYYRAKNLTDALEALTAGPGPTRVIAGGSDLLLDLQQGRHPPVHTLVDVTALPELTCLEIRQGRLFVGAAIPLNRIVASPLAGEHAQALVEACELIGGPQVRNTATLGGNVAHALPAADGTIALMALEAQAEVAGPGGSRCLPLGDLFLGPGRSALTPQEVLVGFYLPLKEPGQASAFRRVMRPQGVAIAILNMAAWVLRQGEMLEDVRLAAGPTGPTPRRLIKAEAALRGRRLDKQGLERARQAFLEEAYFRTSPHRSTTEYRRHLSGALLEDTLWAAWERALMVWND